MRFLVDEGVPVGVTPLLRATGHDVLDPRESNLRGSPDEVLLLKALEADRVLIPCDVDLGGRAMNAMEAGRPVGAVLVRFPPVGPVDNLIAGMMDAVQSQAAIRVGALAVIPPRNVRVRTIQPEH